MFKKADLQIYEIDIKDIIMTSPTDPGNPGDFTGEEEDPI